jgi:hypothetical protein
VHVETGNPGTQDARSQIIYSRIFSWEVIGIAPQYAAISDWLGNCAAAHAPRVQVSLEQSEFCLQVPVPVAEFATWKSLKIECPH